MSEGGEGFGGLTLVNPAVDRESWTEEYRLLVEENARLLEGSLRKYVEQAWPIVEPGRQFKGNWHIDAICDHLEACSRGEITRLVITMPPRHMKSLNADVFFPTWEWASAPWLRYLYASYAVELAQRDSVKCRQIVESAWYQERWGRRFRLTKREEARLENDHRGIRLSVGVAGGATGEGGERLVVDDAHKISEVESDAERKRVLDWYDTEMATRANEPALCVRIVIGQRTHQSDLPGHLLDQGNWEHLDLPAEYEPGASKRHTSIGWSDPRTEPGELLWPEHVGPKEIASLKLMGEYKYVAIFQQKPSPPGGIIFKREWWKTYREDPHRIARRADAVLISVDCAFKDHVSNSRVAFGVWAKLAANVYLLDLVADHMSFTKTCSMLLILCERWPEAFTKLIEDKANGPAVINSLNQQVMGLVPHPVKGSKEARAHAVSPLVEAGNVWTPPEEDYPWVDRFKTEMAAFPKGRFNDMVDQATQALSKLAGSAVFDLAAFAADVANPTTEVELEAEIEKQFEESDAENAAFYEELQRELGERPRMRP